MTGRLLLAMLILDYDIAAGVFIDLHIRYFLLMELCVQTSRNCACKDIV